MHNLCRFSLSVFGSIEDVNQFIDASFGKPAVFSDDNSAVDANDLPSYFCFNATVPVPQDILDAGFDMAGYFWCLEHWGTKWDVYNYKISQDKIIWYCNDGINARVDIELATVWGLPTQWFRAVAKLFPDLIFMFTNLSAAANDFLDPDYCKTEL